MRLLDVSSLERDSLEIYEFLGSDIPKYAILSHTWAEGEVSLQDLQAGRGPSKQGYEKIVLTCKQAKRDGLEWAWVDTCCIDKTSSAELSEAINSMYRWYKESEKCYAYLTDVVDKFPYTSPSDSDSEPQVSRWFTRAWTLQELIAPGDITFYGCGWTKIGTQFDSHISRAIAAITPIPEHIVYRGSSNLSYYSVAQRMSWAAGRSCTRVEDTAYSLMGLFDINMPLLYGEGSKAFVRLQEEILRSTEDQTLLCWTVPKSSPRAWTVEGVFAKSPDDFQESGTVVIGDFDTGYPSAMTNRGLQIHVSLTERRYSEHSHLYAGCRTVLTYNAALNASHRSSRYKESQVSIILVKSPPDSLVPHGALGTRYARLAIPTLNFASLTTIDSEKHWTGQIYIHKTPPVSERERFALGGIHLQNIPIRDDLTILSQTRIDRRLFGDSEVVRVDVSTISTLWPVTEWCNTYGFVKFTSDPRSMTKHSYSAFFEVKPSAGESFYILFYWNATYFHFGIHLGDDSFGLFGNLPQKYIHRISDPSNPSTKQGNCTTMYGEIARTSASMNLKSGMMPVEVDFILEREKPLNDYLEPIGDRLHFLIRAEKKEVACVE